MLRPKATEKGLKFDILQCDDLPGTIISDPTRLRQCLINLVNNAIKFTDKGHVYVNLSIEQIDNDSFIRFDVEDTGIGMTDEQQQIVFEEFQQADQTITRKFGGTGLGLSITKRLTEMLGGHISLKSAPGKGSVFTMHVPLEIAEESTPMDKYGIVNQYDTAAVPHGNIYGVKILVAEDARANQKLLEVYLQKMGFFVKIVENGKDAVEEALSGNYDLILMDIQMPVMNGYEATKLIREHGLSIPVIAVTANAMAGDEEKCLAAGCDDYMPKPISGPRLYDLIGQYLAARA
jgi:CheY-like chemotaxis protein